MATITTGPEPAKTKRRKAETRDPKSPKTSTQRAVPAPAWASPIKPSLVLLPPKARGLKARRKAVRQAMFVSAGLLGATAVAYVIVLAGVAGAQAELNKEQAITHQATEFLAQNRETQNYADGFIQRKMAASEALDSDVAFSRVVQAINGANTVGAVYTSVKSVAAGTACTSSSPFAPSTSIGCLTVSGKAPSVGAVAQLVASLNKDKAMLAEPYLTESAVVEDGVAFTFSVGYTGQGQSLKSDKFKPSPEELSTIDTPAAVTETQGAAK